MLCYKYNNTTLRTFSSVEIRCWRQLGGKGAKTGRRCIILGELRALIHEHQSAAPVGVNLKLQTIGLQPLR